MRRSAPVFVAPPTARQRVPERPPHPTRSQPGQVGAVSPTPPRAKARRVKRRSWLWRYRRVWFLLGLLAFTALAGMAWVITHVPLPTAAPIAETSILYDATGAQLAVLHGDQNRFPVRLDQVPKVTQDAVVAAEDRNFFSHRGVDPLGVVRAAWADIRHGAYRQGGSTITQQYVKNVYVQGNRKRTLVQKLKEAVIAVKLEHKLSKREILERYLNTVYFGRGAYGVQAAAKAYFGKDVGQLGLEESAYLAGLIRSPSSGDVYADPALAIRLRSFVLTSMIRTKAITRADASAVEGVSLRAYVIPPVQRDTTVTSNVKGVEYFVEYVRQQLLRKYSVEEVLRGGLRVYTTLVPKFQDLAYDAVYTETLNRAGDPAGALVSLDPDGRVVAMVGGRDWAQSQVNLAVGTDGGGLGRQGGSAFKPFVLAEAVKEGYSVQSSFVGPAKIVLPKADGGNDWEVHNYDDASYGRLNLIDATAYSVNTIYAQLVTSIPFGPQRVAELAQGLGINSTLTPPHVSITLGTSEVSVLEMADAYLTFAKEGVHADARVLKRVLVGDTVLLDDRPKVKRVLERTQADTVNFALHQVVLKGSGTGARLPNGEAWGKSGTTENFGDAWFVGFNHQLTTAVWMGYPSGQSKPMQWVHGVARVNGGSLPAMIWRRFMSQAAGNDTLQYPVPDRFGGKALGPLLPFRTVSSGSASSPAPPAPARAATVATAPPTTSGSSPVTQPVATTVVVATTLPVTPTTRARPPPTTPASLPVPSVPRPTR